MTYLAYQSWRFKPLRIQLFAARAVDVAIGRGNTKFPPCHYRYMPRVHAATLVYHRHWHGTLSAQLMIEECSIFLADMSDDDSATVFMLLRAAWRFCG